MAHILIVDDEADLASLVEFNLQQAGLETSVALTGAQALQLAKARVPDVVLLDLMLPDVGGKEVCRRLRADPKTRSVPIVMLTARGEESDRVEGFEVGADDYVTKPYRLRELIARMRAVLRRAPKDDELRGSADALEVGDVRLDPDRHEVVIRGEEVNLPLKEFELLALLLENAGRVLTRDTLIDRVWGSDYVGDTKTLDVHIKRLRSKVEDDPSNPTRIVTIRGLGYKFELPR
jgi:two-component system response regulator RegX3